MMAVRFLLILCLLSTCQCQVFYNFQSPLYTVSEGGQVVITIQRTSADTSPRTLVVLLQNSSTDVIGDSQVAVFQPADLTALVTFAAVDDDLPEPEEWLMMLLTSTDPKVSVGSQHTASLVIAASDNAAGVFSFEHPGPIYITEGETTQLNITRTAGAFYSVDLHLVISKGGDIEISNNGSMHVAVGERFIAVSMMAYDDVIPENEEVFMVSLSTTHEHASVQQANKQIIIASSDAPVRFSQATYYATERDVQSEMVLEVLRGRVTVGGEIIGPVDTILSVEYVVIASQLHANDFVLENGTLEFGAGQLSSNITAQIMADDLPELEEEFKVVLVSTSTNSLLVHPSTATVIIVANDDQHGVVFFHSINDNPAYIDEDQDVPRVSLVVSRTGGTYGQIEVEFNISGEESTLSEITPTSGHISFVEGQSSATVNVSAVADSTPEVSSLYQMTLTSVSGGARLGEYIHTDIIIQDSDIAHGSVQWRSGAHSIHTELSPRYISWTVERTGGYHGDVAVTFLCSYSFNGVVVPDILTSNSPFQVVLRDGNASASVAVEINDSVFLSIGGVFEVVIDEVKLLTETDPPSFNSPYKGAVRSDQVVVDASDANGMIGFQQLGVIQAFEPDTGSNRVSIPLSREGTSGTATVSWEILTTNSSSSADAQDVVSLSGEAVLLAGSSSGNVVVEVIADELSEMEESFIVNLTGVWPSDTQRLKENLTQVTVNILENDNPGGTFQIQGNVSVPIVKEGESFSIYIERSGGHLLSRSILYSMSTGGTEEFFGATGLLTFAAGESVKSVQLVTVDDDIPEVNETFMFSIRSHGHPPAVLGEQTSVVIIISENDSPYGQFHFQPNCSYILYESKAGNISTVLVPVIRSAGTFHSVTVSWQLDPSAAADLSQISGVIEFQPEQDLAFIELSSLPDQIPEPTEHFLLTLTSASSSAEIVTPNSTTLSVIYNDAAVFFKSPSVLEILEGETVQLMVVRTEASQAASVRYQTVNGTALASDFHQVVGEIQFSQGQTTAVIELPTVDDNVPEQKEYFYVDLFEPKGDLVMYNVTRAVVFIQANDDPNGVFSFLGPFHVEAMEGDIIQITISRAEGWFGEVVLSWILKTDGVALESGREFLSTAGHVQFTQGMVESSLQLEVLADGIPELDESYTLELFNATGDLSNHSLISSNYSSINITILANDEPNGVLLFDGGSIELSVAEDVNDGDVNDTKVQFDLLRAEGLFGEIKVLWEVYSSQVAGVIPHQVDLLFVSEMGRQVQLVEPRGGAPSQRVYRFTGESASYSTFDSLDRLSSNFAISFWMEPWPNCNGYVLAKASNMSLTYYSLRVEANSDGSPISLWLSLTDDEINAAEVQLTLAELQHALTPASQWQHVFVNLQADRADFIINGVLAAQKVIPTTRLDGEGTAYIGTAPSLEGKYTGMLADLRLYSRNLSPREIAEVIQRPSQLDIDPVSGIVDMSVGQSRAVIHLRSVQDVEAESNEVFSIKLISVKGGAKLSIASSQAKLTVLKSDNANGLFGLEGPCQPAEAVQEGVTVSCLVRRSRDDAGTVILSWNITQLYTSLPPSHQRDFTNSSGEVVFSPGQLFGEIRLQTLSDGIPELEETFQLTLLTADPVDGTETTPTSGASINPDSDQSLVKIASNDFPNGLLQFASNTSPDVNGEIVVAVDQPEVHIDEGAGILRLLVERAQGLLGVIRVDWMTRDGTATSSVVASPDYEPTQGQLTFSERQRYAYVNVTILEDSMPEDVEYFFVDLLNPRNGAAVGLGATVKVILSPSDDAFGVISFEQASLTQLTTEEQGSASTVLLTVVREGGLIGSMQVTWRVETDPGSDFLVSSGLVELAEGVTRANVVLNVRPDVIPELDEVFHVKLVNVSRGRLGDEGSLVSTITILANDDPYGVFVVSEMTTTVRVTESMSEVRVSISRMGGQMGPVDVWYETAAPSFQSPYYPAAVTKATHNDFLSVTNASITFAPGQVNATITLTIFEDDVPEPDEYFFVHLFSASLLSGGQERPLANSPRIGSGASAIAAVVIEANDNANGILQLSDSRVYVEEGVTTPILYVERSAGFYGEVTVRFEVVPGNATPSMDYYYTSNNVILSDQEHSKQLPVYISDDVVPELSELFTVRLLPFITGGATLGNVSECKVIILESDDPYGVFEFTTLETAVEEPSEGVNNLDLVVSRFGGTMNAVAVLWSATNEQGISAADDIHPASGTIYYLAGQGSQVISIEVKADTVPEIAEVVTVNLTLATNGARIGVNHLFRLNIPANDNAHGSVEFVSPQYQVMEKENESISNITIERSGGRFGELKVYYSTSMVDLLLLAAMIAPDGADSLWFYGAGVAGQANVSGTVIDKSDQDNPLQACAEFCLLEKTCSSFDMNQSSLMCSWYNVQVETISVLPSSSSVRFYSKVVTRVGHLYQSQAQKNLDYLSVNSGMVTIGDGESSAHLPVVILSDAQPEINEIFHVVLESVELVGRSTADAANEPTVGTNSTATIIISSNDDANGIFRIYSRDPRAELDGHRVYVEERERYSVQLVVERTGGTIGDVSIAWSIDKSVSNASRSSDYIADGATLTFANGESTKAVTIGIEDDLLPEHNEVLVVRLIHPQKGAEVAAGRDSVAVVILANDHVAGVVGFTTTSYIANEGDSIDVEISRTEPAAGSVAVMWSIEGVNGHQPSANFLNTSGSIFFEHGETMVVLSLLVLRDDVPEVDEEYQVKLSDVTTQSVPESGAAIIDRQSSTATLTVGASNNPHGVFSLASSSLDLELMEEGEGHHLVIDRKFGVIGTVRVNYTLMSGHVTDLIGELEEAAEGEDFTQTTSFIDIGNGSKSGHIPLDIIDDSIPEVREVFLVNLTGVQLVGRMANGDNLPRLATTNTLTQVFIAANDGTRGRIEFPADYLHLLVNETSTQLQVSVQRTYGTYGPVSTFIYSQTSHNALLHQDYNFTARELYFLPGESIQYVNVTIFDDDVPEDSESFELVLASPRGGATLGERVAEITIRENDGSGGVVQFFSNDTIYVQELSSPTSYPTSTTVQLSRGPGLFGVVEVEFVIIDSEGNKSTDISPSHGTVLFLPQQEIATIELSVVNDDIPEVEETFTLKLTSQFPSLLGVLTEKTILVARSDAPYGMFSLTTADNKTDVFVQETEDVITFNIHRAGGRSGVVSVTVEAVAQTATSSDGPDLHVAPLQLFDFEASIYCAYDQYLLALNAGNGSSESALLKWDGVYRHMTYIESENAIRCFFQSISNATHLMVVNQGRNALQTVNSHLFIINDDESIRRVATVTTQQVVDAVASVVSNRNYLIIITGYESYSAQLYSVYSDKVEQTGAPVELSSSATLATHNALVAIGQATNVKVYRIGVGGLTLVQTVDVEGVTSIDLSTAGDQTLLSLTQPDSLRVYQLINGLFVSLTHTPAIDLQEVAGFHLMNQLMFIVSTANSSSVIRWSGSDLVKVWADNSTGSLMPIHGPKATGNELMFGSAGTPSGLSLVAMLQQADFIARKLSLEFKEGETVKELSVPVLDDEMPEDVESFRVILSDPLGGAVLSTDRAVTVNILANDNPHGVVGFAMSSRELQVTEEAEDYAVQLTLVREGGTFGRVVVSWQSSLSPDVSPGQGEVEFSPGQSVAQISITVRADNSPENDELVTITLTGAVLAGGSFSGAQASIGGVTSASMLILANDSPYGFVRWERQTVIVAEPAAPADVTVPLTIVREQGSVGHLQISYITSKDLSLRSNSQATSGLDYMSAQGRVIMAENQTLTTVNVSIRADDLPEKEEAFLVNITSVRLLDVDNAVIQPTVRRPGDVVTVVIAENDNARGIIEFNVELNAEGRVDVNEEAGEDTLLRLRVTRSVGYFGEQRLLWQILPREASADDLSSLTGSTYFEEGQRNATVDVYILDDMLPETVEMFDVQLISVSGGATLGTQRSVRVAILKNDSPRGLFGFSQSFYHIRETERAVNLLVERLYNYQGAVNVYWQFEVNALADFDFPHSGSVQFLPDQRQANISLNVKLDAILEGEERYILSITSADNGADVSAARGSVEVVIEADPGSSGVIEVAPEYRNVLVAEPDGVHDGKQVIVLDRGVGMFGEVTVTWNILPVVPSSFAKTDGQVVFEDGQQRVSVQLQTVDDNVPELKKTYQFLVASATGGASVSSDSFQATIKYAASDYPFGLFQFPSSAAITVSEDTSQVMLTVTRGQGLLGHVQVHYTTSAGSALAGEDYMPREGSLTFAAGASSVTFSVGILQDDVAERDETFYVNLTHCNLDSSPQPTNFTLVDGLQLDMPPEVGAMSVTPITIIRNDNAEGMIEFDNSSISVHVSESTGVVSLTVVRTVGDYGLVKVNFTVTSATAIAGEDFVLDPGQLSFADRVDSATINIAITADNVQEMTEFFVVTLTSVSGGAILGSKTIAYVTILKSGYPNGRFSFVSPLTRNIMNPTSTFALRLSIRRSGGLKGNQTLHWQIYGPNSLSRLLTTDDIAYVDDSGVETTQGILTWGDGEAGSKDFDLVIKAFTGWEIEKEFLIVIAGIDNDVSSLENGEVDPLAGNVSLTISKNGDPNGIIYLSQASMVKRTFNEPQMDPYLVQYKVERKEGDLGEQQLAWQVVGGEGDISPMAGTVIIPAGEQVATVEFYILPDELPELTEHFVLRLLSVIGGATITPDVNEVSFTIPFNDDPYGVFEFSNTESSVQVEALTLTRYLNISVSRRAGLLGSVNVVVDMSFSGDSLVFPLSETVSFADGQSDADFTVQIYEEVFLELTHTYTATIRDVIYVTGAPIASPPRIGRYSSLTIGVPRDAANSLVKFDLESGRVEENSNQAQIRVVRLGSYGNVQVDWTVMDSGAPDGFVLGQVEPTRGNILGVHGEQYASTNVTLKAVSAPVLYAIKLQGPPLANVVGGAKLDSKDLELRIEPHGVIGFAESLIEVEEHEERVTVPVQRAYGSAGRVLITYAITSGTAMAREDFSLPESGTVMMEGGELTTEITVPIILDPTAERDEHFTIQLVDVTVLLPSDMKYISPRISDYRSNATVTIKANGDPYGLLEVVTVPQRVTETQQSQVRVLVRRSAGTYGRITTQLRSVGGGEAWDPQIVLTAKSQSNNTIREALSNRDSRTAASAASDYTVVNREVVFEEGQTEQSFTIAVLEDNFPEPDEQVFVYLTEPIGGARIARGAADGNKYGYGMFEIVRNDIWNGIIGFADDSLNVTVDEDGDASVTLRLVRASQARFTYDTSVQWEAVFSTDPSMANNLVESNGLVTCASLLNACEFKVRLINDKTPEFGYTFSVRIFNPGEGAQVNPERAVAVVRALPSDYPYGKLDFSQQYIIADRTAVELSVKVIRSGGASHRVSVYYETSTLSDGLMRAGRQISPAIDGTDYRNTSGQLVFEDGVTSADISVELTPQDVMSFNYPKAFKLTLSDPIDGAVLGPLTESTVLIVSPDETDVWRAQVAASEQELDDYTIGLLLDTILSKDARQLNLNSLTVLEHILDVIIKAASQRPLDSPLRKKLIDVFCQLADGEVTASQSRLRLITYFERSLFTLLVGEPCESEFTPYTGITCPHFKFSLVSVLPHRVSNFLFSSSTRNSLQLGDITVRSSASNQSCTQIQFIEYNNAHWFSSATQLLDDKVLAVNLDKDMSGSSVSYKMFTENGRRTDKRAECVYFDEQREMWTSGSDICTVTNLLDLGTTDVVQCRCDHLSSFAVRTQTRDKKFIGYPNYMFIIAGLTMFGLLLVLLVHVVFPSANQFMIRLVTHQLACTFALLGVYLLSAFLSPSTSPSPILVVDGVSNHRCAIVGALLHYFFLAQFVWILLQCINLWLILIKNDEHTKRLHCYYITFGYGSSAAFVGVFYGVVYSIYRRDNLDPNFIYGDVGNEQEMCFLTNQYAALAGVVAPVAVCTIGVLVFLAEIGYQAKLWKSYDDIYRGRPNGRELTPLIFLWLITLLTNMAGGLHMAYNYNWMMVTFCATLIILLLFTVGYFAILRGPCFKPRPKLSESKEAESSLSQFQAPSLVVTTDGETLHQMPQIQLPPSQITANNGLLVSVPRQQPRRWSYDEDRDTPESSGFHRTESCGFDPRRQLTSMEDTNDLGDLINALTDASAEQLNLSVESTNGSLSSSEKQQSYGMTQRVSIADTHL